MSTLQRTRADRGESGLETELEQGEARYEQLQQEEAAVMADLKGGLVRRVENIAASGDNMQAPRPDTCVCCYIVIQFVGGRMSALFSSSYRLTTLN